MRLLVSIEHPAWAHQFRYIIKELQRRGHEVTVIAINKDRDLELLDSFGIPYIVISDTPGFNTFEKGVIFLKTLVKIFTIARRTKPDVFFGRASPMMTLNAFLFRRPHYVFEDSEPNRFSILISKWFSTKIVTPQDLRWDLGEKQLRLNTYKELFYLHPNHFTPDPSVLSMLTGDPEEKIILFRFVSMTAHHDIGQHGIIQKAPFVERMLPYGRVFISAECELPASLEQYRAPIPVDRIHDLLFYTTLLITDSQTMTTEAAVLGTPAIRCNSFVGPHDMSNYRELENEYGLIFNIADEEEAEEKAIALISDPGLKSSWADRRTHFLETKVDPNQFFLDLIEGDG